MKTLHLMRHAKSSWTDPQLGDHERELNERGRRDAPRMGRAIAERVSAMPVHCSTAIRAQRTLEGMCTTWPALAKQPHLIDSELYTFDARDLVAWLQDLRAEDSSCFLLGHNPALTDLCNFLTGRPALDNLPTAGYLRFSLPVEEWVDLTEGVGVLEHYIFPKDLPS
ncbi:MAG: histidine phosphatase family protein [Pseudomonadota bacterium]